MYRSRGFGLCSRGGSPTSPATGYPLGLQVLDTWTLGICGLKLVEPTLSLLPRVDCMLMPDPIASYFMELGPLLGAH